MPGKKKPKAKVFPAVNIDSLAANRTAWIKYSAFYKFGGDYYIDKGALAYDEPSDKRGSARHIEVTKDTKGKYFVDLTSCFEDYAVPEASATGEGDIPVKEVTGYKPSVKVDADGWPTDDLYDGWEDRVSIKGMKNNSIGWAQADALVQRFNGATYLYEYMLVYDGPEEFEGKEFIIVYKSGGRYWTSTENVLDNISWNSELAPGLIETRVVSTGQDFPVNGARKYRAVMGIDEPEEEEPPIRTEAGDVRNTWKKRYKKKSKAPSPADQKIEPRKNYPMRKLPEGVPAWTTTDAVRWTDTENRQPFINLDATFTIERTSPDQRVPVMYLENGVYVVDLSRVQDEIGISVTQGKGIELSPKIAVAWAPIFFTEKDEETVVEPDDDGSELGVNMNRFSLIKMDG